MVDFLMRKAHDRHFLPNESWSVDRKKSLYRLWDISKWVPLMSRYWFCMLQFFVKLWWRPELLSSGDYLSDRCSLRLGGARIRLCCTGINSRQMEEWMKLAICSICITISCFAMIQLLSFNIWAERLLTCMQIIFWHWNLTQGFTYRKTCLRTCFQILLSMQSDRCC